MIEIIILFSKVSTTVDSRALEYLLVCQSSNLKHLILYLGATQYDKQGYSGELQDALIQ